jgi:predicted nuclease with RNAse H fold
MTGAAKGKSFSIGWDVGGWSCDDNPRSRDAIVILDSTPTIVGEPWWGNLRECIATAATTSDWLKALFAKCGAEYPDEPLSVTMAIDTPLGFSDEFVGLVNRRECVEPDATSGRNRYLFRHTERHLFEKGLAPLSAVKDMIGSQATKGMHILAKFAPQIESCGAWTDGHGFRAIETYPTACRATKAIKKFLNGRNKLKPDDKEDARICALVAHLFATDRSTLEAPDDKVPHSEGWIWVPRRTIRA